MRKIAKCKQLTWKKIAEKNTISYNSGSEFDINGKKIAIFNQNGYHALDAICVHQDNPITAGKLDGDIGNAHHIFGIIISRQANFRII